MPDTPSKEEQIREANERQSQKTQVRAAQEVPPEPIADLAAPEHDAAASEPTARGKVPPIDPDAAKAPVMGKSTRDDIAMRFRSQRKAAEQQAKEDLTEEIADFTQDGFPTELVARTSHQPVQDDDEEVPVPVVAEVEPEPEPEPEGEESVYVIKVRGKEIELTEAQLEALAGKIDGPGTVVERAQKAAASDEYLKELRDTLADTKRIRDELLAQRGSPRATHPGAQDDATHTTEPATATGDIAHPDDPFAKAVEAIQFGNTEEAARILKEAVTKTTVTSAKGASEDSITDEQMRREAERANRIGKAFEEAHPDLAKDEFSREAIINRCVRLQHDDLVALSKELGIDPAKVPKNSAEIQHWHRFYRAKSFNVRDPEVLLNKAKDEFVAWKGGEAKPDGQTEAPQARTKPRVEISLERRTRRSTIQQQPSRTVNPRPDVRQQQPVTKDRSAIVQEMIQQRNMPKVIPKRIARAAS